MVIDMEKYEEEIKEATIQVFIGLMSRCNGYDEQTRQELIREYLELEAA